MNPTTGYTRQILGSIQKHPGELALGACALITLGVVYAAGFTRYLSLQSLASLIVAALLLHVALAAWRLNRNQQISITTKQTLLDLDAFDRAESEQTLRAHYQKREEGIQTRHEADVKKLSDRVAGLKLQLRGDQP